MAKLSSSAESPIAAPADVVLDGLRDFDGRHRRILPPAFSDLVIEEGGHGEGTVTSFMFTVGGRAMPTRTRVTEPEPGVIEETVDGRDMVTRFEIRPDGAGSHARITTRWESTTGVSGVLERLFLPRMLRDVYREELSRLDAVAREAAAGAA
jgi:hypothetical protein